MTKQWSTVYYVARKFDSHGPYISYHHDSWLTRHNVGNANNVTFEFNLNTMVHYARGGDIFQAHIFSNMRVNR